MEPSEPGLQGQGLHQNPRLFKSRLRRQQDSQVERDHWGFQEQTVWGVWKNASEMGVCGIQRNRIRRQYGIYREQLGKEGIPFFAEPCRVMTVLSPWCSWKDRVWRSRHRMNRMKKFFKKIIRTLAYVKIRYYLCIVVSWKTHNCYERSPFVLRFYWTDIEPL